MPYPSRRKDVLAAASRRFFRDGITATGVDRVIADAGVAKMTLYGNFGSKDELIVAYLEQRDERFFAQLDHEVAASGDPLERAMAPVRLYRRYLDEEGFHGCAFVNAGAELPRDHPGRAVIAAHKKRMLQRWGKLVSELGIEPSEDVAEECFLLAEGAFTQAGVGTGSDLIDVAERLIHRRLSSLREQGT